MTQQNITKRTKENYCNVHRYRHSVQTQVFYVSTIDHMVEKTFKVSEGGNIGLQFFYDRIHFYVGLKRCLQHIFKLITYIFLIIHIFFQMNHLIWDQQSIVFSTVLGPFFNLCRQFIYLSRFRCPTHVWTSWCEFHFLFRPIKLYKYTVDI